MTSQLHPVDSTAENPTASSTSLWEARGGDLGIFASQDKDVTDSRENMHAPEEADTLSSILVGLKAKESAKLTEAMKLLEEHYKTFTEHTKQPIQGLDDQFQGAFDGLDGDIEISAAAVRKVINTVREQRDEAAQSSVGKIRSFLKILYPFARLSFNLFRGVAPVALLLITLSLGRSQ